METRFKVGGAHKRSLLANMIVDAPWYARDDLQKMLERDDGPPLDVTVTNVRKRHTDAQRGYYWLCVGILSKHMLDRSDKAAKNATHEIVLCQAFGSKSITVDGQTYQIANERSHDKDVAEYSGLIETLIQCADFVGCRLPDPIDVG